MALWTPKIISGSQPAYLSIADAISRDMETGALQSGDRLPPQRKLADLLGLDFTTVSRGYKEAERRGLVEGHVGRGTFISGALPDGDVTDPMRTAQVDLTMNLPPEPSDPDLINRMRGGLADVSANLVSLLRYQSGVGSEKDKEAASIWLSMRGMVPRLDRIAITPGAHPAIVAILHTIAAPGDVVACEAITYPGIRRICKQLNLNLVGLAFDEEGILPEALSEAIKDHGPVALYLNPTLNNPTTRTMSTDRRMAIARILQHHNLPLIEDDAYGFVPARAPAPLATMAPNLTWHVGGLAKCIGAGLRLAYVVAPDSRQTLSLEQALKAISIMASPVTMALVTRWITDGTADRIRRFVRKEAAARQEIVAKCLPNANYVSDPEAFNIWLTLPHGWHRADVVARMAGRGLGIVPSDGFVVTDEPKEQLRICLGGPLSRSRLHEGLEFLGHTLDFGLWAE
ncbi:PLP-dependent aminotransferase family protein [Gymnodinialimonas sp. 2305UL16-5]|uniref:aminotransferase-like domain-containing protein n=1 Tax=Gymnodinialimonas mytili TaxID=3126503 RepID=UPI0030AE9711